MQDYLFPVLSTVLGPGEIAYWAQTGEAFKLLGMEMPIVTPRLSFTLIDPASAKTMETFGISLQDAYTRIAEIKDNWLREQDRFGISDVFQEAAERMREAYAPVLAMAASLEKGLDELGQTNWERILREIRYFEGKTKQSLENRESAAISRMNALSDLLAPDGRPQERLLASVYYLNVYGRRWLDDLLMAPYEPCMGHRIAWL